MLRRSFLKSLAGLFLAAPAIRSVVPAELPDEFERTFLVNELDDERYLFGMVGRLNEDPFEGYARHEIRIVTINGKRIGPKQFRATFHFRRVEPVFALVASNVGIRKIMASEVYGSTMFNRPGLLQMIDDRPSIFGRLFRARSA